MCVPLSHDGLVEHGVVVAGRISRDQSGRDADAPEHEHGGGRELLAVAGLDVEEEPVHGVPAWRDVAEVERVRVAVLQVARQRHHRAVLAGRVLDELQGELPRAEGEGALLQVRVHRLGQ